MFHAMKRLPTAALLAAALAVGCARGFNYVGPGPRYAGGQPRAAGTGTVARAAADPRVIRVVTFNVYHATRVDSSIALLRQTAELQDADVLALQETDAPATARIAQALGMAYVYYPATRHPRYHRDFGNAVLSRWPIVADQKVVLPHLGRFRRTARTATAVTIALGGTAVRVYSVHLGTKGEIGPRARRNQVRAVLDDAAPHPYVIVLGDMNSHGIGESLQAAGYAWPTAHNPRTLAFGNWDHVFLKGLAPANRRPSGVVADSRTASDHRAVWVLVAPPAPPPRGAASGQ